MPIDEIITPCVARAQSEPVPCSPEAERWLLGFALRRPNALEGLSAPPLLFLDAVNRAVWSRLLWLRGQGPWDLRTALESFTPHSPEWDRIVDCDWSAWEWETAQFVAMLRRTAEARRLLSVAQELAEAAYACDLERADDVLALAGWSSAPIGFDIPEVVHGR